MISDAGANMVATLEKPENRQNFRIEEGDCGVLIGRNGDIRLFQTGIDTSALNKPVDNMTEAERQVLENGELLFALGIVARNPQVKQAILNAAYSEGGISYAASNQA